jgi:hypothetical protein
MKKLFIILFIIFMASQTCLAQQLKLTSGLVIDDCCITRNFESGSETFPLRANVRVIPSDSKEKADFDICVVSKNEYSDICVKKVTTQPAKCLEWRFVSEGETFTVKYVSKKNADILIEFCKHGGISNVL